MYRKENMSHCSNCSTCSVCGESHYTNSEVVRGIKLIFGDRAADYSRRGINIYGMDYNEFIKESVQDFVRTVAKYDFTDGYGKAIFRPNHEVLR